MKVEEESELFVPISVTMGLSDFQVKKLKQVYRNLYDSNHDGIIDKEDFKDVMNKISQMHHWGTNDDAYTEAQGTLATVWDGLRDAADTNKDGRVTEDEWLAMWTRTLQEVEAGNAFPDWQQKYVEFMFLANDTSGDGFIDKEEFVAIQTKLFGHKEDDSHKAFAELSQGVENSMISKQDFTSLWKEYFLSREEGKRGNFLFGLPPK